MINIYKYSIGIVLFFVGASCSSQKVMKAGQEEFLPSIEEVHGENCSVFTCVQELNPKLQAELNKKGQRLLQIYLIRHAKPNLRKKAFYSVEEAQQYLTDYNLVPIHPIKPGVVKVNLLPNHTIHCSSLRRSKETAHGIFGDQFPIVSDSLFREFEIKAIRARTVVKLPLPIWQAFSRGSWFLGFNHKGIESFKEARKRASLCAKKLVESAHKEETAILVGHGMLNAAIEKELEKQGWHAIQDKGHINLGATILVKVVEM